MDEGFMAAKVPDFQYETGSSSPEAAILFGARGTADAG
jgi:hypothetical protein